MIFLDSSYIKGLMIKRDPHKKFSNNIRPFLKNETKVINITVLVEVLNALKKNNFQGSINDIINQLLNLDIFDWLSVEDYKSAAEFKYYNGSVNFADCTILVTMEKYGITKIVTTDSDFGKIRGIRRISGIF
jgi:predicted nucleic acid-binding protein